MTSYDRDLVGLDCWEGIVLVASHCYGRLEVGMYCFVSFNFHFNVHWAFECLIVGMTIKKLFAFVYTPLLNDYAD